MRINRITNIPLEHYEQTIGEIFRMAKSYAQDVKAFRWLTIAQFYDVLKSLEYRKDPPAEETVSRPGFTMDPDWKGPRDCDDKTAAAGAWFELRGIPWRVVVAGKRSHAHHVYPEVTVPTPAGNVWMPFDATFPHRGAMGERLYAADPFGEENFRRVYYPTGFPA